MGESWIQKPDGSTVIKGADGKFAGNMPAPRDPESRPTVPHRDPGVRNDSRDPLTAEQIRELQTPVDFGRTTAGTLRPGDYVDLAGDLYADPDNSEPDWTYEYAEVVAVTQSPNGGFVVEFHNSTAVAFPANHELRLGKEISETQRHWRDTERQDQVLRAYAEAALWSSTISTADGEDDFLDNEYGWDDLSPTLQDDMRTTVTDFLESNADTLADMDPGQAGHDLWLTRNRHGAGFWDRGIGERGTELTESAHAYGEQYLYVGDDGKVYGD